MEAWEKDLHEFIKQKHPDHAFDKDGKPTRAPDLPPEIIREWIKSRNPKAVFEVDGVPMAKISDVMNRHMSDLQRMVRGYIGQGIDKDGAYVEVIKDMGQQPLEIEGVKIRIKIRTLIPRLASAFSGHLVGNNQEFVGRTTEVSIHTLHQFCCRQQTGGLDHSPFPLAPMRLQGIEPGAFAG